MFSGPDSNLLYHKGRVCLARAHSCLPTICDRYRSDWPWPLKLQYFYRWRRDQIVLHCSGHYHRVHPTSTVGWACNHFLIQTHFLMALDVLLLCWNRERDVRGGGWKQILLCFVHALFEIRFSNILATLCEWDSLAFYPNKVTMGKDINCQATASDRDPCLRQVDSSRDLAGDPKYIYITRW